MTIYKWGTGVLDFSSLDQFTGGANAAVSSPYTIEYLQYNNNTPAIIFQIGASLSEVWYSVNVEQVAETSFGSLYFRSGSTILARVVSIDAGATTNYALQTYNGSTYTTVDTYVSAFGDGANFRFDVHLLLHDSTGVFELYANKTLVADFSGDTITNGSTTVDRIDHVGGANVTLYLSAWIIGDESTLDYVVHQPAIAANGSHTDWVNDLLNVDGGGFDETNHIYTDTDGHEETFTFSTNNGAFGSGFDVVSVKLQISARKTGDSAIDFIQGLVRLDSTDYVSSSQELDAGFMSYTFEWTQNPDTAADWVWSDIHPSAQFGVKAASS